MALKFKKLFEKKHDGYYEGPDLLPTTALPARDQTGFVQRKLQSQSRPEERETTEPHWRVYDLGPAPSFSTRRSLQASRPSTGNYDFPQQEVFQPDYKYMIRESLKSSSPSPEPPSSTSDSSPDQPSIPQLRSHYIDILDAAGSSQRSNSPRSSHSPPKPNQYNEEIADRNGVEGMALERDAFRPASNFLKYQEHVADRNIQLDADYQEELNREEAMFRMAKHPDAVSLASKVASLDRPGTSHSSAEIYQLPAQSTKIRHDRQMSNERSRGRPSSIRSSTNAQPRGVPRPKEDLARERSIREATNLLSNDQSIGAVGIAISTDQKWPPEPTSIFNDRRSVRKVLDLTDDNKVAEIAHHPMSKDHVNYHETDAPQGVYEISVYAGNRRRNHAVSQSDPTVITATPDPAPDQVNGHVPKIDGRSSNGQVRTHSGSANKHSFAGVSQTSGNFYDFSHERSIQTRSKQHSGGLSTGETIHDTLDPQTFNDPSNENPQHTSHNPPYTDPRMPSPLRPRRRHPETVRPVPREYHGQRSTPQKFSIKTPPQSQFPPPAAPFPYVVETPSLSNDDTLLLPEPDTLPDEAEADEFTLETCDAEPPMASVMKFDDMVESSQRESGSSRPGTSGSESMRGRGLYEMRDSRVPTRGSSLKAIVGA